MFTTVLCANLCVLQSKTAPHLPPGDDPPNAHHPAGLHPVWAGAHHCYHTASHPPRLLPDCKRQRQGHQRVRSVRHSAQRLRWVGGCWVLGAGCWVLGAGGCRVQRAVDTPCGCRHPLALGLCPMPGWLWHCEHACIPTACQSCSLFPMLLPSAAAADRPICGWEALGVCYEVSRHHLPCLLQCSCTTPTHHAR